MGQSKSAHLSLKHERLQWHSSPVDWTDRSPREYEVKLEFLLSMGGFFFNSLSKFLETELLLFVVVSSHSPFIVCKTVLVLLRGKKNVIALLWRNTRPKFSPYLFSGFCLLIVFFFCLFIGIFIGRMKDCFFNLNMRTM